MGGDRRAAVVEECGISLASLNGMLVIDADTVVPGPRHRPRAVAITVGGASQAVDRLESAWLVRSPGQPIGPALIDRGADPEGLELLGIAAPVFDRELDRLLRAPLPGTALARLADALGTLRRSASPALAGP